MDKMSVWLRESPFGREKICVVSCLPHKNSTTPFSGDDAQLIEESEDSAMQNFRHLRLRDEISVVRNQQNLLRVANF